MNEEYSPENIWQQATIMVVDDEPSNIDIISDILAPYYTVLAATSGEKALELIFSNTPNLILMDIVMPGMDGYTACKKIKQNPRTADIPVIFISGKAEEIDELRAFEAGAVDYLTKPVSPPIIKARVKTQLQLYHQIKLLQSVVLRTSDELHGFQLDFLERLTRVVEFKSNGTGNHLVRIGRYCLKIALAYGMEPEKAEILARAVPMHDIGKMVMPDETFLEPETMTDKEFDIVRQHPLRGAEIIGDSSLELLQTARSAALTHHERWDGRGYPHQLKGEMIPLEGRILAVADAFDSLTDPHCYKSPWTPEEAIVYIEKERGKAFDPGVVEAFCKAFPEIMEIYKELGE